MHLLYLLLAMVVVAGMVVCSLLLAIRSPAGGRRFFQNIAKPTLLCGTCGILFIGLEAYHYLHVQSDGFIYTLAGRRWHELYDKPYNQVGYRDFDHPLDDPDRKLLLIVGDSFTQGFGIRNIDDRFDKQLAHRAGPDWMVAIAAEGGWDTLEELEALKAYPRKPDVVILQYYLNDIKHAILAHGLVEAPPPPRITGVKGTLVNNSYAINYWYWRLFRVMDKNIESYWTGIYHAFGDELIWTDHANALNQVIAYTRQAEIPMLVLVFPSMYDVPKSAPVTEKITSHFEEQGIPTLNLAPILSDRSVSSMICNPWDGHPNEQIHHEVGELLAKKLKDLGWLQ
jgi:lysophospholipase L1-like esterase